MRAWSTSTSIKRREITALAVLECVLSFAIYLGIGVYLGSFLHFEIAAILAPLFLLRTKYSFNSALLRYALFSRTIYSFIENVKPDFTNVLKAALVMLSLPVAGITCRVGSTILGSVRHPRATLSSIPDNWIRQSLCTDFVYVPEIVPGEDKHSDVITFRSVIKSIVNIYDSSDNWFGRLFLAFFCLLIIVIGYIPAIILRVSFKSTSFLYAPLAFVAFAATSKHTPTKVRLDRIAKGEIEKTRRWYSLLVGVAILTKLAFLGNFIERNDVIEKYFSGALADLLLSEGRWPWWQVSLAAEAALTFCLFYFADAALGRLKEGHPWPDNFVRSFLTYATFLRAALALAALAYGVAIAAGALLTPGT